MSHDQNKQPEFGVCSKEDMLKLVREIHARRKELGGFPCPTCNANIEDLFGDLALALTTLTLALHASQAPNAILTSNNFANESFSKLAAWHCHMIVSAQEELERQENSKRAQSDVRAKQTRDN